MDLFVDLDLYRSKGSRVFAGRERGAEVRRLSGIDEAERSGRRIVIHIPEDVLSVNSSFWLGLVGDSVRRLREQRFRDLFRLDSPTHQDVYESGIAKALRFSNPLAPDSRGGTGRRG